MLPSDWQMTSSAFLCFAMALINPVGALNQKVDAVADINPTKLAWNLKVGIVRLYEFPSKWNPREIYSMELVLQDEKGNIMKCTLFGDLVDKALGLFDKDDGQPIILVAQLFKPNFYLNEVNVQNSLYASRLFFNPEILDVLAFKNRCVESQRWILNRSGVVVASVLLHSPHPLWPSIDALIW
ncbi:hypothetical protein AHAS_Ahas20G0113100 [Arachis hypogaea]